MVGLSATFCLLICGLFLYVDVFFAVFLSLWGALFSMRGGFLLPFLYAGLFLHVEGAFLLLLSFFLCRGPFLHLWGTFFELAPPYKKLCWRHVPVIVFVLMSNFLYQAAEHEHHTMHQAFIQFRHHVNFPVLLCMVVYNV